MTHGKPIVWTPERDADLLAHRAAATPWAVISQRMGIGRSACIERARLLGLKPRRIEAPSVGYVERSSVRIDRPALPAGSPQTWDVICAGTVLAGARYPVSQGAV